MTDTIDRNPSVSELQALATLNAERTHQINVLSEKVANHLTRINTTEQILNRTVGEAQRLRKNLYGILGSTQPDTVAALFEQEDRMKLQSIIRRYQSLTADDLITGEQLRDVRACYAKEGEIEIDEDALISADQDLSGGFWVQAWVWWMPGLS